MLDRIKALKEQLAFPSPDPEERFCICGKSIYNVGRDEDGNLLYESRCYDCQSKNRISPKRLAEINNKMAKERAAAWAKRKCRSCGSSKCVPTGRKCAPCIVRDCKPFIDDPDIDVAAGSRKALEYAQKFL